VLFRSGVNARPDTRLLAVCTVALLLGGLLGLVVVEPDERHPTGTALTPSAGKAAIDTATDTVPTPKRNTKPSAPLRTVSIYSGLGTWIDAYDFVPAYHRPAEGPLLVPDDLETVAMRGVRTVYIQAARDDARSPEGIVDHDLVGRFLQRARELGMRVVGWYLPKFADVDADLARLLQIRDFEYEGHRFDGIGVDIEFRSSVRDDALRNRRVVELSRRLRAEVGNQALAAIVLPPALLEVVHPQYWPNFPWQELAPLYDVWLPMGYWSDVKARTGYRDGHRYTSENIARLRANLGDPTALVHAIGGVANLVTDDDYRGFVQAAREGGAVGWSMYDYRTTPPAGWEILQRR
jgi:hypothetical protein